MIPDRLYWDKNFREGQSRSSLQCEENRNSEIKKRKKKNKQQKRREKTRQNGAFGPLPERESEGTFFQINVFIFSCLSLNVFTK